jgi:hypothetical protein
MDIRLGKLPEEEKKRSATITGYGLRMKSNYCDGLLDAR